MAKGEVIRTASKGFAPGDFIHKRYRVTRFIARGGMGEVFEAEDFELGQRVALKTIRPERAENDTAVERFKRELAMARKVTHPNVCRVFDVGFHVPAVGPEVPFFTMEYLEGETLGEHLARHKRLLPKQALPLLAQLAEGLDAAHAVGVIHRDLKSQNVILVPDESRGAVITDFGLARSSQPTERNAAGATNTGAIVGTPAYMSPEQVAGEPLTPASDLYSLGVLAFEMVTGERPFAGDSVLAMARRLTEPPPSPRSLVPLSPAWDRAILRLLARDPHARPRSAREALAGLEQDTAPATLARPRSSRRWQARGALAALVVATAATGVILIDRGTPPATELGARPTVAVIGFHSLSGDPEAAWMSRAFSEMLTSELAASESVRVVPSESVESIKKDLALKDSESFAPGTLARIRSYAGADVTASGSFLALGSGTVRLDVTLADTTTGRTIAAVTDTAPQAELFELVSRVGARLRKDLGAVELDASDAASLRASVPTNVEAARRYAQGVAAIRNYEDQRAIEPLQRAIAADPHFAPARAELAGCWWRLGYEARARNESTLALTSASGLPREQRLQMEAHTHEMNSRWDKAAAIYLTLSNLFPETIAYGIGLARMQVMGGKSNEALKTIEALRKTLGPKGEDPALDLEEAHAAGEVSDWARQNAASERAIARGNARGARHVVAEARLKQATALDYLGRRDRAMEAAVEAKQLFSDSGDRSGVVRALRILSRLHRLTGDFATSKSELDNALEIAESISDRGRTRNVLLSIGNAALEQHHLAAAARAYERATAINREIDDQGSLATVIGNMGMVEQSQGRLAESQKDLEEGIRLFHLVGDRKNEGDILTSLGGTLSLQGHLDAAKQTLEQARALFEETHDRMGIADVTTALADLQRIRGDLEGAVKQLEQVVAVRKQLGERRQVGDAEVTLAFVLVEAGKAPEAERLARTAADELAVAGATESEAAAREALARALLAQHRFADALAAAERAESLLKDSEQVTDRMIVATTVARARGAAGEKSAAIKQLEATRDRAHELGIIEFELDARLGLVEVRGSIEERRQLERDARDRGYLWIAKKAARR